MSDNDEAPLVDNEEWFDNRDDCSADSMEADREDGVELDETVNAVNTDDMIQLLAAVRESEVVKVQEFSDLFDPHDSLADNAPLTYNEVGVRRKSPFFGISRTFFLA